MLQVVIKCKTEAIIVKLTNFVKLYLLKSANRFQNVNNCPPFLLKNTKKAL